MRAQGERPVAVVFRIVTVCMFGPGRQPHFNGPNVRRTDSGTSLGIKAGKSKRLNVLRHGLPPPSPHLAPKRGRGTIVQIDNGFPGIRHLTIPVQIGPDP